MNNFPLPPGPPGPPGPNGPWPQAPAPAQDPPTYDHRTRWPIIYLPVMLNGLHIGYLWAGTDDRAAGFIRRRKYLQEAFDAPFVWMERLEEAYAQGLPAREAVRRWIGRPEHPQGGGVPADAREEVTDGPRTLSRLADPDAEQSPWDSLSDGEFPDGTPMDRSEGWGSLHLELPPGYDLTTDGPVRYLPVTTDGLLLGYLWTGVTGNAALFLPREDAGAPGGSAMAAWTTRLRDLYAQNVPAPEVLDRCRTMPPDPATGAVPPDATVQEAPSLDDLRRLASTYEQSLRISENPLPRDVEVWRRPALDPAERDAVLRYLREAPVAYNGGRRIQDDFAPGSPHPVPDTYQTDGTWIWRGGVAHHLEHHGITPEPDLLQHIRSNGHRLPPLDDSTRETAKQTLRLHRILVPPPAGG